METRSQPFAISDADAISTLERLGVVPVVELKAVEAAAPLLDALSAGGLPVAEVTLRTPAAIDAIRALRRSHPHALIGAGTVLSVVDAETVLEAGAQFVVSPVADPEVIDLCRSAGVLIAAGACTPTEVDAAVRAGAGLVKFFPAEAMGGTACLKALTGPFAGVRFMPSGGIGAANVARYLRLPQVVACGGSWMVAPMLIDERRFDRVELLTRQAMALVRDVRPDA
jgi:2-dehydro-3-deoxyphosphogluconate aldolase / (4S)-4-hydroxy-2-oxoglutarate aldolase